MTSRLLTNDDFEERPWGSFERFTLNEPSTVKILTIAPGARFSLQCHERRSEYWRIVRGSGRAEIGDESFDVVQGDTVEIPAGTKHRLSGGPDGISVLEIAFGDFDENDIERFADDFGRA